MELKFEKTDLGRLVGGDWELVCGCWKKDCADTIGRWLTIKSDGLYLNDCEKAPKLWEHPGREGLVLPLPTFTLAQFKAFCEWHPTFEWEVITSVFTNDDGSIDEDALKGLASRGEAAANLVRGVLLSPDDEYLKAWETHCQIDECRAEIAELKSLKPTTITERMLAKQELDALESRLSSLLNPDAKPVLATPTAIEPQTQFAPSHQAAAPFVAKSAGSAQSRTRRDLLTPAIEAAQKECENQFDAPAVWVALVQMAQTQKHRLLGVSEDGIKWLDTNDEPQFLKIKDLRDRLRRMKQKAL